MLDLKTAIFSYAIINAVCAVVMALLWFQNRKRFAGLGFWLVNFVMQVTGLFLLSLRDLLPVFLSIVVGNTLLLAGGLIMFMGLERFVGKRGSQTHNYILLAVFIVVHSYFTFFKPSLEARDINAALGILLICVQCAWLLFRRADAGMRPTMRGAAIIYVAYSAISLVRVAEVLILPLGEDFFQPGITDMILLLGYQIMFIFLVFSLFLAVNRRLVADLERDIAGRRHAEKALRASEKRFRSLFENMLDGYAFCRMIFEDGKPRDYFYLEVNSAFENLTGIKDAIGKRVTEVIPGMWETNPEIFETYGRVALTGKPEKFETYVTALGMWFSISVYSPRPEHFVTVFENITERKRVDEALRQSEGRFRILIEQAGDGFELLDAQGNYVAVNDATCRMLGYSREEMLRLSILVVDPQQTPEKYSATFLSLVGQQPIAFESLHHRKDGILFPVDVTVSIIQVGEEFFALSLVRDISERKRTDAALLHFAALEERQRLARDMHDSVSQSIHSLVLFSETLGASLEKKRPERTRQIAARLQESARQALKEMRLLLYELNPTVSVAKRDLVRGLEERLAMVERRAGVKAEIIQEGSLDNCPLEWIENLFWITIEALNNALKHARARSVKIFLRCFPQRVELEVIDNGIGFDPAGLHAGGLGLSNMRERANLLGGELVIISAPGEGTCVQFSAEIEE